MIQIAVPKISFDEIQSVINVMRTKMIASGSVVDDFENTFAEYVGSKYAVAVSSGTAALHCAYASLDLKEGDEVITTPFTFAATINMIKAVGATPVFVDIKDDFNIDEELIEQAITERTKAIVPVHLFGKPCKMKQIMKLAKKHSLSVIEDAAQACGSKIGNKFVGTYGDAGIFSYYPTKNMTTSEGGMVVTNSKKIADFCRAYRNHGMSQQYDNGFGYNYRMTNIEAAIGLSQLDKLDSFIGTRRSVAKDYNMYFDGMINCPKDETGETHSYNNYTFCIKNRDKFIKAMEANKIICRVYYPKPYVDLPNATRISKEIVSIPIRPNLTNDEVQHIIFNITEYLKGEN